LADICRISGEPGSRKWRFSHLREKLREKNETASQAGSDDQAKRFVRKTSTFAFSLDIDKATKTPQRTQEKFCEKNAHLLYSLSEPYKPIPGNAEKSLKRKNYLLF
jgi:hypothetical protein